MEFESGERIDKDYCFPDYIMDPNCPLVLIREFLGGLFGGDGISSKLNKSYKKCQFSLSC